MMSMNVLVLCGGPDAEREVSLESGAAIHAALNGVATDDGAIRSILHVIEGRDLEPVADIIERESIDVVFPALHGAFGEGGPLQWALQAMNVPFVGAGPAAAAFAMDKFRTKHAVARLGVATPESMCVRAGDPCTLSAPVVVKPNDDGSSVDLRICHSIADIRAARDELHRRRTSLLVERYRPGRELTVGIIDGEPLPIIEITPATEYYDYEAKYARNDTIYTVDPVLPAAVRDALTEGALAAWEATGARDLARVDFLLDDEGPWFLELNTMPGFTSHSLVPMAAEAAGRPMDVLCRDLVTAARERGIDRSQETAELRPI